MDSIKSSLKSIIQVFKSPRAASLWFLTLIILTILISISIAVGFYAYSISKNTVAGMKANRIEEEKAETKKIFNTVDAEVWVAEMTKSKNTFDDFMATAPAPTPSDIKKKTDEAVSTLLEESSVTSVKNEPVQTAPIRKEVFVKPVR